MAEAEIAVFASTARGAATLTSLPTLIVNHKSEPFNDLRPMQVSCLLFLLTTNE